MKEFSATATIAATPARVWEILTDAPRYPEWDPNMVRLDGTVALGQKVTAHTKISDRAFPVTVSTFEPERTMVWSSGMPLGLFKGERTFLLTPQNDGTVLVSVREVFTGLLLPLIGRTIPDLSDTFTQFVAGLKQRAEQG
jgi:hypothetical protein